MAVRHNINSMELLYHRQRQQSRRITQNLPKSVKENAELQPQQNTAEKTNRYTFPLIRASRTGRYMRLLIRANGHALPLIHANRHVLLQTRASRYAPAFGLTARLLFKITSAVQQPLYKGLHKTLLYTKRPDLQGFCETCIFFHIFPYTRKTLQNQGFSTHCIMYKRFSKPFIHIFSLHSTVNRH